MVEQRSPKPLIGVRLPYRLFKKKKGWFNLVEDLIKLSLEELNFLNETKRKELLPYHPILMALNNSLTCAKKI